MITNFGSSAGQNQAKEATVVPTHFSYFHLAAIGEVHVFHAKLYQSTFQCHATQFFIESTRRLIIVSDVLFLITLLKTSILYFITFLSG
jgi:hypothetical protein